MAFERSETAAVCIADDEMLQHLRTDGGRVDAVFTGSGAALEAAGWAHEPRLTHVPSHEGTLTRTYVKDGVATRLMVNQSADRKYLVTTLFDDSDKLARLWQKPADYDVVLSAGRAVQQQLWPVVSGRRANRKTPCPAGSSAGVVIDYSYLATATNDQPLLYSPRWSGQELSAVSHNAGAGGNEDYLKDAMYRYNKRLTEVPAIVVRTEAYEGPGGSAGTRSFSGGRVSGSVFVVQDGQLLCEARFSAGNSDEILEGDQHNDLRSNVGRAVLDALR